MLDHSNIIKCHGSESGESLILILEYMPGGSLASLIQMFGPLKENLIRKYLKQIIEALRYIHSKGVVHRDLKAANILLNSDGKIKLSDFSVSGKLDINGKNDFLNSLKGAIPWMAPEVICQSNYDCKSDIWSLGCLLIELTTGQIPSEKFDNLISAMLKIGKTESLPTIPNYISHELRSFISSCLQRDPNLRPEADTLSHHAFLN
jgi:mitogen-activated protein kinase kinase kinase